MDTTRNNRVITIIFIPSFLAILGMLIWKCSYGFPSDEALYLLIPMRFIDGDIPLIHEWHPTQLSAIWLHPIVALFLKIAGSTEGIFLTFRYIFTGCWALCSLFIFFRLRRISSLAALFSSLILFIYVPYGEMALYYNTIALMTLISSAVIIITAEKFKTVQYAVAGALYAIAVTCCPFLISVFAVAVIYVIVRLIRKDKNPMFVLLKSLIGCAFVFVIFACYYLLRVPAGQLMDSLPRVLSDRAHPLDLWDKIATYVLSVATSIPVVAGAVLWGIIFIIVFLRNSKRARITGFALVCLTVAIQQILFLILNDYINHYMLAPMLIGLYVFIFSRDETVGLIFRFMWVPGLIYTFAIHLSSNLGFSAICSAATVMTIASAVMGVRFVIAEQDGGDISVVRPAVIAIIALMTFQIGLECYKRASYVFENVPMSSMDTRMESGSASGIISTSNRQFYYACMDYDTAPLRAGDVDRVLILSPEAWLYVNTGKKVASYTSWSLEIDDLMLDQLDEYYDLYPDKKPDIIYVESYYADLVPRLESQGYKAEKTLLGGYVLR